MAKQKTANNYGISKQEALKADKILRKLYDSEISKASAYMQKNECGSAKVNLDTAQHISKVLSLLLDVIVY